MFVHFDSEDGGRAARTRDRDRKKPDRPAADDGDGLADDLAGKHGVNGIAEIRRPVLEVNGCG